MVWVEVEEFDFMGKSRAGRMGRCVYRELKREMNVEGDEEGELEA